MRQIVALLNAFARDQRGATALEYGFIAAFMSLAAIAILTQIGVNVGELTGGILTGLR